jgi:hypothetical protein
VLLFEVKELGVVAIVVPQFSPLQLAVLRFEVKELGVVAIVVLQFNCEEAAQNSISRRPRASPAPDRD